MDFNNISFIRLLIIIIKYTSFLYLLSCAIFLLPYPIRNKYIKNNKRKNTFRGIFFFCRAISLIVLALAISMSFSLYHEYRNIKNIIDCEEYQMVEGNLDGYLLISDASDNCELFDINGISFNTKNYFSGVPKEMGLYQGELIGEISEKVKVYYVNNYRGNRQNTIIYIEEQMN